MGNRLPAALAEENRRHNLQRLRQVHCERILKWLRPSPAPRRGRLFMT